MPTRVRAIDPVLPVRDVHAAVAFYAQIGFALVADFLPQYAIVQRDDVHLHLRDAVNELAAQANPAGIYVYVDDVHAFYEECVRANMPALGQPQQQPWGVDFAISDPDGNLIRVGQVEGR